jgi:endonuclease III related protein
LGKSGVVNVPHPSLTLPFLRGYRRLPMSFAAKPVPTSLVRIGPSSREGPPRNVPRDTQPPLDEYFNSLFTALGPQHWWPGNNPFEVVLGAILTQNTSWKNVEQAISNLREADLLSPPAIQNANLRRLERLLRPSGYFRQKARKLRAFCTFLQTEYAGSLDGMFATPTIVLREKLLGVYGIGPETADSILLYAGGHGVFVVDTYTKRMLARHGWVGENPKYNNVQWLFERQFPGNSKLFNEFHALIVQAGKRWCLAQNPRCEECPLGRYLEKDR